MFDVSKVKIMRKIVPIVLHQNILQMLINIG